MSDPSGLDEATGALRDAQAALATLTDTEKRREFFARLFATPSDRRLREVKAIARGCLPGLEGAEVEAINARLSDAVGAGDLGLRWDAAKLVFFHEFFFGAYLRPLVPIDTRYDEALQRFYSKLLASDPALTSLRGLQRDIGDFWNNGDPTEAEIIGRLRTIEDLAPDQSGVPWDARHLAAFATLLTLDEDFKWLAPFEVSGSIW